MLDHELVRLRSDNFHFLLLTVEVNAYTELNDSVIQHILYLGQEKDKEKGNDEAQPTDELALVL